MSCKRHQKTNFKFCSLPRFLYKRDVKALCYCIWNITYVKSYLQTKFLNLYDIAQNKKLVPNVTLLADFALIYLVRISRLSRICSRIFLKKKYFCHCPVTFVHITSLAQISINTINYPNMSRKYHKYYRLLISALCSSCLAGGRTVFETNYTTSFSTNVKPIKL